MKIVADSYAWIEIFSGSATGREAKDSMESADGILTPDTVLAEIARKYLREGFDENVIRKRLATIVETSEQVQITNSVALEAARASLQLEKKAEEEGLEQPSLIDGIVLATARDNQAKVLTGDPHFKGLPETVWLEKL